MKTLNLNEARAVIDSHPELRAHMIPLISGLVIDDKFLIVADPDANISVIDLTGLEDLL